MKDSTIINYLEQKEGNSKEILIFLHEIIKANFPQIECSIKWGMPHYDYKGLMCGIGLFKNHVNLYFHKGNEMNDPYGYFNGQEKNKANRSIKYTSIEAIDTKIVVEYIQNAIQINDKEINLTIKSAKEKTLDIPEILKDALEKNQKAKFHFENFPYYKKKEFVDWITNAKREETKQNRLNQSIELLQKGIGKEDKYRK